MFEPWRWTRTASAGTFAEVAAAQVLWQAADDRQPERPHSLGSKRLVGTSVFKAGEQSRSLAELFRSQRDSRSVLNDPTFGLNVFTCSFFFFFCSGRNQKMVFSDDTSSFISLSQQENV